ncbi:MAG: hypothetical protein SGI77_18410 [Pirellulaceae bacterium]|nr:hypothetical protein [Pirellulaceae bacterium]
MKTIQGDNSSNHDTTKPSVLLGSDGCLLPLMGDLVTPTGLELSTKSLGKSSGSDSVPMPVPIRGADELLSIWSALDESARRDLLNVARAWAAKPVNG